MSCVLEVLLSNEEYVTVWNVSAVESSKVVTHQGLEECT